MSSRRVSAHLIAVMTLKYCNANCKLATPQALFTSEQKLLRVYLQCRYVTGHYVREHGVSRISHYSHNVGAISALRHHHRSYAGSRTQRARAEPFPGRRSATCTMAHNERIQLCIRESMYNYNYLQLIM